MILTIHLWIWDSPYIGTVIRPFLLRYSSSGLPTLDIKKDGTSQCKLPLSAGTPVSPL